MGSVVSRAALPSFDASYQTLDDGDYDTHLMELNKEWAWAKKYPTCKAAAQGDIQEEPGVEPKSPRP